MRNNIPLHKLGAVIAVTAVGPGRVCLTARACLLFLGYHPLTTLRLSDPLAENHKMDMA